MLARFEEKLKTDEEDGKKATEVVQAFQHALDYKNRSVVERASEKFMQDVEDDQDLDTALSVWRPELVTVLDYATLKYLTNYLSITYFI